MLLNSFSILISFWLRTMYAPDKKKEQIDTLTKETYQAHIVLIILLFCFNNKMNVILKCSVQKSAPHLLIYLPKINVVSAK